MLETERLRLRRLSVDDAAFVLELLNDPSFIRNIGDRGVRTLPDARRYILAGPVASYAQHGYGLYAVELRDSGISVGICGLLKRDWLDDVDLGLAFLPQHWFRGYATESAAAVKAHALGALGFTRIVAITSQDNYDSIRVLEKVGFRFDRMIQSPEDEPALRLFTSDG